MNRVLFLLCIGLGGAAILIWLGLWQMQRLAWKEGVIAQIDARIAAAPQALPDTFDPEADAYLPVQVEGRYAGNDLRVLVSQKDVGAGYRIITPFDTGARRIMVDRGFIPTDAVMPQAPTSPVTVTGNLQWPRETDGFTPAPDLAGNIWFARDVSAMAEVLGTEPVMLVARETSSAAAGIEPLPVDTARIPNDHLQYAVTWFSLAAIWLAMTALFLRRHRAAEPVRG